MGGDSAIIKNLQKMRTATKTEDLIPGEKYMLNNIKTVMEFVKHDEQGDPVFKNQSIKLFFENEDGETHFYKHGIITKKWYKISLFQRFLNWLSK